MTKIFIADEILLGPPNRRKARRKRVLLSGVLVSDMGRWSLDCTIRQLSIFGAQIAFEADVTFPNDTYLVDTKNCMAYRARIAWRQPKLAGLEFRQAFPIDRALPSSLDYLQTALVARKMRQVNALFARGMALADALRTAAVSAEAYQAWRKENGGDAIEPAQHFEGLEALNAQLQEPVSAPKERVLAEQKKA